MGTQVISVNPYYPEMDKVAYAAKIIRQGGLVVFPTETVYGVAADYNNPKAMVRLREVKKRSENKPFSIMIANTNSLSVLTSYQGTTLYKMIDKYWPGPLTIVASSPEEGKTIGIRMPDHAVALNIVKESQCVVAAPSANVEGNSPPRTCQEALRDLEGQVELAIDSGPSKFGQSSSVVDFTSSSPKVIREGVINQGDVDRIAKLKTILFICTGNSCRSVMAEYLLRHRLGNRDNVEVISAGTGVFVRSTASLETVEVLRREGIDATGHLSQPVNNILLKKADLILVMTRNHRQQILERVPEVEKRVYLLREFANIPSGYSMDLDIPDPIGKPPEAYAECFWLVKEAIEKIVKLI